MGQTIRTLAAKPLPSKTVFNNRLVIEICEAVHIHYRNLRIIQSISAFEKIGGAFANALDRWKRRGEPETERGRHIELARVQVDQSSHADDMVRINLNKNLYPENAGKIFSEGAEIEDDTYLHVKIRDLRIELSRQEFVIIADAFTEAKAKLIDGQIGAAPQQMREDSAKALHAAQEEGSLEG